MKVSIVALAAVSLMGFKTMASDSISANIFILNNSKHAESGSNTIHSYLAKSSTSTVITAMRGAGNFASLNQTKNESKSTVVGVDVQGYTQTVLQDAGDGRISMNTDSNLTASDGNLDMTVAYQLEGEAVITKGSWQSYLQGEEIEFQLTEQSLEKEAKVAGKNFSKSIEAALRKGLVAQGLNSITMNSDVTVKAQDEDTQVCKATLASLDCFRAKQAFEILIRIDGL